MKLKQLSIKNITSIEDAVINFDASPLSNAPIFLITGPTGAGKAFITVPKAIITQELRG